MIALPLFCIFQCILIHAMASDNKRGTRQCISFNIIHFPRILFFLLKEWQSKYNTTICKLTTMIRLVCFLKWQTNKFNSICWEKHWGFMIMITDMFLFSHKQYSFYFQCLFLEQYLHDSLQPYSPTYVMNQCFLQSLWWRWWICFLHFSGNLSLQWQSLS